MSRTRKDKPARQRRAASAELREIEREIEWAVEDERLPFNMLALMRDYGVIECVRVLIQATRPDNRYTLQNIVAIRFAEMNEVYEEGEDESD